VIDVGLQGLDGILKLAHRRVPPPATPSSSFGFASVSTCLPLGELNRTNGTNKPCLNLAASRSSLATRRLDFGLERLAFPEFARAPAWNLDWVGILFLARWIVPAESESTSKPRPHFYCHTRGLVGAGGESDDEEQCSGWARMA